MEIAEQGFTRLGKAASLLAAMTCGVVLFGSAVGIRADRLNLEQCMDCHPTGRATSLENLDGNDERDG
jgi:hypothetical protein